MLVGEGCSRVCTISVSGGRGVAEFVQLVLVGEGCSRVCHLYKGVLVGGGV